MAGSTRADVIGTSARFDSTGAGSEAVVHRIASTTDPESIMQLRGAVAGGGHGSKAVDAPVQQGHGSDAAKRGATTALLIAWTASCAAAAAAVAAAARAFVEGVHPAMAAVLVGSTVTSLLAVTYLVSTGRRLMGGADGGSHRLRRIEREALEEELRRSRRYERSLAVVRMTPARSGSRDARWRAGVPMSSVYSDRVGHLLRATDHWWQEGPCVYFVLPEANRDHARALVERLAVELPGLPSQVQVAAFPEDGVTVAALWSALDRARSAAAVTP